MIGMKRSVSKLVLAPWITATKRSKPAPVSMFLCGNSLVLTTRNSWVSVKLRQNNVPDFDVTVVFDIFCKTDEDRYFFRVKGFSTVKEDFLYLVQKAPHRFPRSCIFDWNQVTWIYTNSESNGCMNPCRQGI